jgi:hypothetical protein
MGSRSSLGRAARSFTGKKLMTTCNFADVCLTVIPPSPRRLLVTGPWMVDMLRSEYRGGSGSSGNTSTQ